MNARLEYQCACNGLVQAVKDAADPTRSAWIPYNGWRVETAVFFAKLVMRMAIARGLYAAPQAGEDTDVDERELCETWQRLR